MIVLKGIWVFRAVKAGADTVYSLQGRRDRITVTIMIRLLLVLGFVMMINDNLKH
jgi:hypothetical protein